MKIKLAIIGMLSIISFSCLRILQVMMRSYILEVFNLPLPPLN